MMNFTTWKIVAVLASILLGLVIAASNVMPATWRAALPAWYPGGVVLGLDLQGGSHLLLEVDAAAVLKEKVDTLRDDVRRTLRDARIGYTNLGIQNNAVTVTIRETADVEQANELLQPLAQPVGGSLFGAGNLRNVEIVENGSVFTLTPTEAGIRDRMSRAVDQSKEIVERRVNELGTTEPSIQRQGNDRILVQVPGLQDPAQLKAILGTTAKLEFRLVDVSMSAEQAQQTRPPADSEILMSNDPTPVPYLILRQVMVSGESLIDAQASFDSRNGEPVVNFRFDTAGAQRFGRVTTENVNRPFAIVLDNKVISAPVIREPILGGSGQISGNFTPQETQNLALLLRAGALPAPLTIIEERTVGPGLGQDSIEAGQVAAIVGTIAVAVFMIAAYGLFGVFANIALVVNIVLIFALLALLGATLTLPGIAGIVLTIGMAVDSNVLIYERIREEVRAGRSPVSALDAGFTRALGTILDANITTLIAGVILFYLGSGPVRGFAVTLCLGILTTVFTAFTVTRLMVAVWYRWRRPAKLVV